MELVQNSVISTDLNRNSFVETKIMKNSVISTYWIKNSVISAEKYNKYRQNVVDGTVQILKRI